MFAKLTSSVNSMHRCMIAIARLFKLENFAKGTEDMVSARHASSDAYLDISQL